MTEFNRQNPGRQADSGQSPSASFQTPQQHSQRSLHHLSSASSYADLQYLFGLQDPTMLVPKQNRNRRKASQGSEHVKHRRTRSGCYTCRSRRVKCDETRPTCERCKKGGRDCVYPETPSLSKTTSTGAASSNNAQSGTRENIGSSSDEYDEEGGTERLDAIPDGGEREEDNKSAQNPPSKATVQRHSITHSTSGQITTNRQSSETPSLVQDKGASPTPSTEGSVGNAGYQTAGIYRQRRPDVSSPSNSDTLRSDWSHLPPDLQFYLTYFYENITHLHYSLKTNPGDFLKTLFIDAALRNDALLHAVVGFAAFQRTLHNPDGKIQDFLQYYNKAVSLLLNSLKRGEKHSTGTLLAILQLATIEEFLGDWINLLGHQKAAFEILTELYTPQTVMQSEMARVIFGWYTRFDVFAGLMAGFETVLSREWFSYAQEFLQQQVIQEPANLSWKIELAVAQLRLIAMDMGTVFAKIGKREINVDQFIRENKAIGTRIQEWKTKIDPALEDSRYLVTDFTNTRPVDLEDIVDPYVPGTIYSGPLFVMNVCLIDWYSVDLMHSYQTALTLQTQPGPELGRVAYDTCQLYEAVEFYPGSPPGTILSLQASLGIAAIFLPRDDRHAMWARRKFASIEANGYIYPYTYRSKMSDLFRDRSCMHWWLPNDEGYSPIIRSIRKFVEERTAPAKDVSSEDLRDMKAIFSLLNLEDGTQSQPPNMGKGKGQPEHVAVAGSQEWTSNVARGNMQEIGRPSESDGYSFGFDNGPGFWSEDQSGGAYGIPKPRDFR